MNDDMQRAKATKAWGVMHAQGIRWVSGEADARAEMTLMVARDNRSQAHVRGKVRLVCRDIGELVVVEDPYSMGAGDDPA
jgi:hypothetical protein